MQGKDRATKAPNVNELGCQFNALSSICAVAILNAPEEERLNTLINTINLAHHLRKVIFLILIFSFRIIYLFIYLFIYFFAR